MRSTVSHRDALRVLVLVEETVFGELLVDALTAAGLDATLASDEDALAAAFDGEAPRVVVVDTDTRPKPLGRSWLRKARERWPHARTVALLPCGGPLDGEPLPCDATLEKPARLRALVDAVRDAGEP